MPNYTSIISVVIQKRSLEKVIYIVLKMKGKSIFKVFNMLRVVGF